jgi:hypothetical protein
MKTEINTLIVITSYVVKIQMIMINERDGSRNEWTIIAGSDQLNGLQQTQVLDIQSYQVDWTI